MFFSICCSESRLMECMTRLERASDESSSSVQYSANLQVLINWSVWMSLNNLADHLLRHVEDISRGWLEQADDDDLINIDEDDCDSEDESEDEAEDSSVLSQMIFGDTPTRHGDPQQLNNNVLTHPLNHVVHGNQSTRPNNPQLLNYDIHNET